MRYWYWKDASLDRDAIPHLARSSPDQGLSFHLSTLFRYTGTSRTNLVKHRPPACNEQIAGALKPTKPGHQAMGGRRQINSAAGAKYCKAQQILDIGQTAPMTGKEKWLQCAICREILARQLPATQRLILFHVGKSLEQPR